MTELQGGWVIELLDIISNCLLFLCAGSCGDFAWSNIKKYGCHQEIIKKYTIFLDIGPGYQASGNLL